MDFVEAIDTEDDGLCDGFGGGLRRFATSGLTGGVGGASVEEGRSGAGLEDGMTGGLGASELPDSERYEESLFAPVSTPPRLFNFGIPPANNPPNCGADGTAPESAPPPLPPPLPALLLRILFSSLPPGTGGARPPGGFAIPGTGGALPRAGPELSGFLSTIGAERSLVTAFFS